MPFPQPRNCRVTFALISWLTFDYGLQADEIKTVNFSREIRPLLSDTCFRCHGPDEKQRVSDFRLDTKEGAFAELGDHQPIVAGDALKSELVRRITSDDPDYQMPPPTAERRLGKSQIQLLTRWIEEGAAWEEHWSFVSPVRPKQPATNDKLWRKNPIDDFVLAQLEARSLQPTAQTARTKLLRRVSLDLIGLPPTLTEIDDFLADTSDQAYEKVVDRLLDSPRYGERMALLWLDAARYADTSGYQNDGPRYMWRWRDWVIDSFNQNMPYDQFTIEQLAGDLLIAPERLDHFTTVENVGQGRAWRGAAVLEKDLLDHLIPTGFNRNHRGNAEGGIIPEEYQMEYVVDRVDTTFTVWLGLTIGCSRCHDHKYDPLKQREFYEAFAFFNNIPEYGRAIKEGNSPPFIKAPTRQQQKQLATIDRELEAALLKVDELSDPLDSALATWESNVDRKNSTDWTVTKGLVGHFRLDGNVANDIAGSHQARFERPGGAFIQGPINQAAQFNGECHIDAGDFADFSYFDRFSLSAWIFPTKDTGTIISRMTPEAQSDGYYVHLQDGQLEVNLVKRWLDDSIRITTVRQLALNQWQHVAITYDGSRIANGIKIYLDGQLEPQQVNQDFINQTFAAAAQPVRIGGGSHDFFGAIDDVRLYERDLSATEVQLVATAQTIVEILATPRPERTEAQIAKLRTYFIQYHAPQPIREAHAQLRQLQESKEDFLTDIPTLMVMQERTTPRKTHILSRGQYDKPIAPVTANVPAAFPGLPADAPKNRLGFARWLVSGKHPLTARVAVNRFWQIYFGRGLVSTTEDFGAQGELPSHPLLLDWLATEFVENGWNVKALQKLIVMSATYQQSSQSTAEIRARDPDNRLLARGPRFRLPAETVRDQSLAVSGLLKHRLGGPSVRPYQPAGLWKEIATDTNYDQSHGDDLYRRSLYTYWKRTVAPPTMVTFDATAREACTVKRSRTNTPLQALALMNEKGFVEAARVFAESVMAKVDKTPTERIRVMFRQATSREPTLTELEVLLQGHQHYYQAFSANQQAAEELCSVGEFPRNENLAAEEVAALTTVASLIMNMDEVLTKE